MSNGKELTEKIARLVSNLKNTSWVMRWSAAYELGEMRNPAAVDPLIETLKDKDFDVRRGVVEALGKIGDSRATPYLVRALNDTEKEVRLSAIRALGRLKDKRAVGPLLEFLEQEDKEDLDLYKFVIHELGEIGDVKAVEPLLRILKIYTLQSYVVRALIKIGEEAVPQLIKALESGDGETRRLVAFALGKIRSFQAVDSLIQILEKEKEKDVLQEVIRALGKIADKKAVDALRKILQEDEYLQLEAALALKRLGDPEGKKFLEEHIRGRIVEDTKGYEE